MVGVLGLGTRHSPSADMPRSDTSRSVANLKPAPSPAESVFAPGSTSSIPGAGIHFFSLPQWTRRMLSAPSPTRKSPPHVSGRSANSHRLLLEKDLPPTPSPPSQADTDLASHGTSPHLNDARVSITIQHVTEPPPQSTFHLDVYHNAPLTSSQINSVAFTPFPNSSTENALRKSKSTHSLSSPTPTPEQQRTRGISLTRMFGTVKQAPTSPVPTSGRSSAAPLARKSSFWSRKFSTTSPQHLDVPTESPSLPVLNAISPLWVDLTAPPASLPQSRSNSGGAGLFRRHSERAVRRSPTARTTSTPSLPQSGAAPDRTNVRPSTADPHSHISHHAPMQRPTTTDSAVSSRSRSLFTFTQSPKVPSLDNESFSALPSKIGPRSSRPRSSTNPPLLHRLSVNLFASAPSSATKSGPSSSNGAMLPASGSPRPSLSQIPHDVLKPRASESSETFVHRLVTLVSKADIVGILASTGDPIYVDALKSFIERFNFHGDPLDVALRRLLMNVGLPRETQQIDRVIEAFANRYLSCNPDLFTTRDHPYILAFSLIMLHTDAFNKSNRRKMSKADYLRNTTLPGLIPEVLDCFYDNIVFAPFIFIEDPLDPEGTPEGNLTRPSTSSGLSSPMIPSANTLLSRPKIDPYYLIMNNLLDQLRVNVDGQISPENPFRWEGTGAPWSYDEILLDFARGHMIQIGLTDTRPVNPFFGLSAGSIPSPSLNGLGGAPETLPVFETWTVRFTKVAVLNRKDDLLEGGKRPLSRKWRPYSVALTKSSLLLFRDLTWASVLLSWDDQPRKTPIASTSFKPDEIISLDGALAVLNRAYSKHLNTFHLTTRHGRHILFQATGAKEMNEWISRINYASTFKTAGIRMRSLGMTSKILELTGVAAATSHLHDLQLPNVGQPGTLTQDHHNHFRSMDEPPEHGGSHDGRYVETDGYQSGSDVLSTPEVEEASQFQETFDTVKAELAAARISAGDLSAVEKAHSAMPESPRLASRSRMIHTRVEDLEDRICAANAQIDSSMHIARSIAVLTPFQKSTRDRLQDTIQTVSKKIQAMRLDVTKLVCHRNILLNDLAAEERNFKRATSLALQAATETLQQRYSEYARSSLSSQEFRPKNSSYEESSPHGLQSFDSSAHRSTLDLGPDWPSSGEAFASPTLWAPPLSVDSPVMQGFDDPTGCHPYPDEPSCLTLSTTNQSLLDTSLHTNLHVVPDSPEEQAEEWNKTRAAKRVSLVKLPSDWRVLAIGGKSSRHPQGTSLLKEELHVVGTSVT